MDLKKIIEINQVQKASELYAKWIASKERVLLNLFSKLERESNIVNLLEGGQEIIVSFIVGPTFFDGTKSTLSTKGWLDLIQSSGAKILEREENKLEVVMDDANALYIDQYWQQHNPYKDNSTLKEILFITCLIEKSDLESVKCLDTIYSCPEIAPKKILYLIHFFQDLVFLRALNLRFRSSDIIVIINKENMAFHHLAIIDKFLLNYEIISYTMTSFSFDLYDNIGLFMTATLGVETPMHLSCSRLVEKIRDSGIVSITLQHGITIPKIYTTITEYVLTWNENATLKVISSSSKALIPKVINSGSVRPILKPNSNFFHQVLGDWVAHFRKYIMIGTNLHWDKVHKVDGSTISQFIYEQCQLNPDILFIIRPHPEDYNLNALILPSNALILDDMITGLLDLSIDEILVNCDGLISTYSTLLYDAARLGTPIASFDRELSIVDDRGMYLELDGLDIIKNNKPFDIVDWLSKGRFGERGNADAFNNTILDLMNKVGSPMKEEEKIYIKNLHLQYKITAYNYGRKAYKDTLESGFLRRIGHE